MIRIKRKLSGAALAACAVAGTFGTIGLGHAVAATYIFNTTKATLNNSNLGMSLGDEFNSRITNGVATFTFNGDVTFQAGDVIQVLGNNPLDIVSYNNITLPSGVTIDVSANASGIAGGGNGGYYGAYGTGGAAGLAPLSGLLPSTRAFFPVPDFGSGGSGGNVDYSGNAGGAGAAGVASSAWIGQAGGAGTAGSSGAAGTAGFNGAPGGNAGAGGSIAGAAGALGATGGGGYAGSGGALTFSTAYGGGDGGSGSNGANGGNGQSGQAGVAGTDGANRGTGLILTAGSGGGGGGGGQGSGGGGAGGLGGGGGGGGGGAGDAFGTGGTGGAGGPGGLSGSGGSGGDGGIGGIGGGGGGAVELNAYGSVTVAGGLLAEGGRGSPGQAGQYGAAGQSGLLGLVGGAGSSGSGNSNVSGGASGGSGGYGGNGGSGGNGGTGGTGGAGGAGAGGTILVDGSSVNISGASINVSGGDGTANSSGRFVVGANNTNIGAATIIGAQNQAYTGQTSRNLFIEDGSSAPNISNLAGGVANAFGILANLAATNASLSPVVAHAPKGALAALVVNGTGLPGYANEFGGYQWAFLVNLSGKPLQNVRIGFDPRGIDTRFALSLQELTTSGMTLSLVPVSAMGSSQIFSFLAPTADLSTGLFNVTATGAEALHVNSAYELGNISYLMATPTSTPEPESLLIFATGAVVLLTRRRKGGSRLRY